MPRPKQPIYLDANTLIEWFQGDDSDHQDIVRAIAGVIFDVNRGHRRLAFSTLLISEAASCAEFTDALLKLPSKALCMSVTRKIALMARDLVQNHALKGADAIHLATAHEMNCCLMVTSDAKMLRLGTYGGVRLVRPCDDLGQIQPSLEGL